MQRTLKDSIEVLLRTILPDDIPDFEFTLEPTMVSRRYYLSITCIVPYDSPILIFGRKELDLWRLGVTSSIKNALRGFLDLDVIVDHISIVAKPFFDDNKRQIRLQKEAVDKLSQFFS